MIEPTPIKKIEQIISKLNRTNNEPVVLYTPYHDLFWRNDLFQLLSFVGGAITSRIREMELLTQNPFKQLELHIKYETNNENTVRLEIETPDPTVDLLEVLFGQFLCPWRYSYLGTYVQKRDKIKASFRLTEFEGCTNKILLTLPDYITYPLKNCGGNLAALFSDMRTDIRYLFNTQIPLFEDRDQSILHTLKMYKKVISTTRTFIRNKTLNLLVNSAYSPETAITLIYGRFATTGKATDTALLRKVFMRLNQNTEAVKNEFFKNYKKVIKDIDNGLISPSDIDLESMLDYNRWNSSIRDFLLFNNGEVSGRREHYFKNYINKYRSITNERKRSQASHCVSQ